MLGFMVSLGLVSLEFGLKPQIMFHFFASFVNFMLYRNLSDFL